MSINFEVNPHLLSRLSPHTQFIVRVLGWNKALFFFKKYGGKDIYIPIKIGKSKLFESMDDEQANSIIDEYSGTVMHFPKHELMLVYERAFLILADLNRGLNVASVMRKYNVSRRQVFRVQQFGVKNVI